VWNLHAEVERLLLAGIGPAGSGKTNMLTRPELRISSEILRGSGLCP
jgi:hypothetical protein